MGLADKKEKGKKNLDGRGSPVDFGSRYEFSILLGRALNPDSEDHSEDRDTEDHELPEQGAAISDSDPDESEHVNYGEFKSVEELGSGERDSREHELRPHGASLAVPMASALMSLVSPSQQLLPPSSDMLPSDSVKLSASLGIVSSSGSLTATEAVSNGSPDVQRREIRLGLPSKGHLYEGTLDLFKNCGLPVKRDNDRQYDGKIPQLSNLEVWFQRPKDIVRKLLSGDLDIGIVGLDTVSEYGQGNKDLIIVHEALNYGGCHLSLAIPKDGIFEKINSVTELAQMPQWTEEKPLRVATGFAYLGPKLLKENGLKHVSFSTGEGALEAAPAMGTADVILDLVSSGTTLKENNLKEIVGGRVFSSQAVLVASRKSLVQWEGVRDTTREILERLEGHLKAVGQIMVTANMRGSSAEEVAQLVLSQPSISSLQAPTVSQVFCKCNGEVVADDYAIGICVPKEALFSSVQQLRAIGGRGVLASQLTYIFDEESTRWLQLLSNLGH